MEKRTNFSANWALEQLYQLYYGRPETRRFNREKIFYNILRSPRFERHLLKRTALFLQKMIKKTTMKKKTEWYKHRHSA